MFLDFSVESIRKLIILGYNSNFLEYFDEYQKDSISGIMILQKFSKNDYIIREREQAVAVFILKEVIFFYYSITFIKNLYKVIIFF